MVVMGKIVAAQGIQGWVKVQTFTEYLDSLLDYDVWYLGNEAAWQATKVLEAKVHGKVVVAKLEGVADRNEAERLKGRLVAVPRAELPEQDEDEYYWSDLIGMTVRNQQDEVLGTVENLLETGANDVLVLQGAHGQLMLPFIESVVQDVDLAGKIIRVDWKADYLK